MPAIDVVDSTWIRTAPAALAALVAEPSQWPRWWPRLRLVVAEDRGAEGVRWRVEPSGGLAGSMEVWIEPVLDGVVAHYFLRLDAVTGQRLSPRRAGRLAHDYHVRAKTLFWTLGDRLDPGRLGRLADPDRPEPRPTHRGSR